MKGKKFWMVLVGVASALIIGTTVAGWLGIGTPTDNENTDNDTAQAAIVCVDDTLA